MKKSNLSDEEWAIRQRISDIIERLTDKETFPKGDERTKRVSDKLVEFFRNNSGLALGKRSSLTLKKHQVLLTDPRVWEHFLRIVNDGGSNRNKMIPAKKIRPTTKYSFSPTLPERVWRGFSGLRSLLGRETFEYEYDGEPQAWRDLLNHVWKQIRDGKDRRPLLAPPSGASAEIQGRPASKGAPQTIVAAAGVVETTGPSEHQRRTKIADNVSGRRRYGNIYGREVLLKKIGNSCRRSIKAASSVTALTGMGGMGKTQTAIEYACLNKAAYSALLFIDAENSDSLKNGFVELAREEALRLPKDYLGQFENAGTAVVEWMDDNPTWLLILDNIDTPDVAAEALDQVRRCKNGHVLITGRFTEWPAGIKTHKTLEISLSEAVTLLREEAVRRNKPATDLQDARSLAQVLGKCPDLLEQAAAWIRVGGSSFADFHHQWKSTSGLFLYDPEDEAKTRVEKKRYRRSAVTWLTSIPALKKTSRAFELLQMLSWLSSAPIPRELLVNASLEEALRELARYSFVTRVHKTRAKKFDAFTINSALQDTTRNAEKWQKALAGTPLEEFTRGADKRLLEVARLIADVFPSDEEGFMPHVVSVLHHLHQQDVEEFDLFDSMNKLVVRALRSISPGYANIDHLITVLGDFYEIDPLSPALNFLAKKKPLWCEIQGQLLDANNYVLRYAMAEAMAKANAWSVDEFITLTGKGVSLNEFELGGYALELRYSRNPALIKPEHLQRLADRDAYSGCSILGDLFLNLVFQPDNRQPGALQDLVDNRFWEPAWEFVQIDVDAINAGQVMMKRLAYAVLTDDAKVEFKRLQALTRNVMDMAASEEMQAQKKVRALLDGYLGLDYDENLDISKAESEVSELGIATRQDFFRLLFAHPVWSVAEAAASLLSSLIGAAEKARQSESVGSLLLIVKNLLHDKDWRVRYGAHEAAFQVRNVREDPEFFHDSIKTCKESDNCKIQGLCAENLISQMLNSSPERRNIIYTKFRDKFQFWINHDDAWVLEHVYRLFRRLQVTEKPPLIDLNSNERVDPMALARKSSLLGGLKLHEMPRDAFLGEIELRKRRLPKKPHSKIR